MHYQSVSQQRQRPAVKGVARHALLDISKPIRVGDIVYITETVSLTYLKEVREANSSIVGNTALHKPWWARDSETREQGANMQT